MQIADAAEPVMRGKVAPFVIFQSHSTSQHSWSRNNITANAKRKTAAQIRRIRCFLSAVSEKADIWGCGPGEAAISGRFPALSSLRR